MRVAQVTLPFYEFVLDFLASGPSSREIIDFRPSNEVTARFADLLEANRNGLLSPDEAEELDHYLQIDRMVSLLKAKAYRILDSSNQ